MIYGIDVSENQPALTTERLATAYRAGVRFCYVRGTMGLYGADSYDQNFAANWHALHAFNKIAFGAYAFARPQPGRDGAAECDHLMNAIQAAGGLPRAALRLPLACDAEWQNGMDRKGLARFFERWGGRAIAHTGDKMALYSGAWWWNANTAAWVRNVKFTWVSLYGSSWPSARIAGFGAPGIFQTSGDGKGPNPTSFPGVEGADVNRASNLQALLVKSRPPAPPVLKRGSRGADVRALSAELIEIHYLTGSPRLFYTAGMEGAVRRFQSLHLVQFPRIHVTGQADPETRRAIAATAAWHRSHPTKGQLGRASVYGEVKAGREVT